jgi:uncharacterized membrane protein YfcA
MIEEMIIFISLGVFSGLIAGLFGIGGGTLIVPVLVACFFSMGFEESIIVHLALGTSMACIFFTGLASANAHKKKNAIDFGVMKPVVIGIIFGSFLGAIFAIQIAGSILKIIIGLFALFVAIQIGFQLELRRRKSDNKSTSYVAGSSIGFLSSILGIGGGIFSVSYFKSSGLSLTTSIGTSAACGVPIAIFASLGYIFVGFNNSVLPPMSIGYIYLPAVIGVSITSIFTAVYGAKLAHFISEKLLRNLLISLMLAISIYMIAL